MKSEILENEKAYYVPPFPKLMKMKDGDLIVLFVNRKSGTVVHENYRFYGIGHNSGHWNYENFEPFTGKVVLSNEV